MDALRFLVIAVAGVVLDLAISFMMVELFGVPLLIAAAVGFILAAIVNYIAHELWTFRGGERRMSAARSLQYVGASLVGLLSRLLAVALLSSWFVSAPYMIILIAAASVSLVINFTISKFWIFSKPPKKKRQPL